MKQRPLIIDPLIEAAVRMQIAIARERGFIDLASATKLSVGIPSSTTTLTLAETMGSNALRDTMNIPEPVSITIPVGFDVALSFEEQPHGMCMHVSISVADATMLPNPVAIEMITKLYGLIPPFDLVWEEEFRPGHYAINIVALAPPEKTQ